MQLANLNANDVLITIAAATNKALTVLTYYLAFSLPWHWSQNHLDYFISTQRTISRTNLLANIGPNGSRVYGANPGVVIASPSIKDPDYFYTWTRDSALVFKYLIDEYTLRGDTSLRPLIDDFVSSQAKLQNVTNLSGSPSSGGLGEPKFHANETAFADSWGRPQRDGPALRSITLIVLANYLLSHNEREYVETSLWPIIQRDLDYVGKHWNESTFDLWEEVSSSSYFTTAAQHRAMRQGSALASSLGRSPVVAEYEANAESLLCFLQSYWNPSGFVTANTGGGRSGIDANTVLASTHMFDPSAGCDSITLQPCSDKALSNIWQYVEAFRQVYPINHGTPYPLPISTGRYSEDVYYDGNPWYLTTLAVAEQLYDALIVWNTTGSLEVTPVSLPFFHLFNSTIRPAIYGSDSPEYWLLMRSVRTYADGFVRVVARFTPFDGSLAEQFNKTTAAPMSALDLTWSYAASLTAFDAREGRTPTSWGAGGLIFPPSCSTTNGIPTTFRVHADTVWGEGVYLTGSTEKLKHWSSDSALTLSAGSYPIWQVTVYLPASTRFEYKYIRKQGSEFKWASNPNMQGETPADGSLLLEDEWR